MIIVPMTTDHLRRIKVREMERIDMGDNFIERNIAEYSSSEFKRAVLDDEGEVVFVFGGKKIAEDKGWVWLLASDLISRNPIASMESVIELHKEARRLHPEIKYYCTFNNPDFPFAIRFLERLGYQQRMITNAFNDGKDRILLVKEIQ